VVFCGEDPERHFLIGSGSCTVDFGRLHIGAGSGTLFTETDSVLICSLDLLAFIGFMGENFMGENFDATGLRLQVGVYSA
jgi:hypothetical protein